METELVFPRKVFVIVVIHLIELLICKCIIQLQLHRWPSQIYRLKNHPNHHTWIIWFVCQVLASPGFLHHLGLVLRKYRSKVFFSLTRQVTTDNHHVSTRETPQTLKEEEGRKGRKMKKENRKILTDGQIPCGRITELQKKKKTTIYNFQLFLFLKFCCKFEDSTSLIILVGHRE